MASPLGFAAGPTPTPSTAGDATVVWEIGTEDGKYDDLAIAGQYRDYKVKFPRKVLLYEIGKSAPSSNWPYVQPGTIDAWGSRGDQPRTIRFTLKDPPRGVFVLRIAMVDVHPNNPSALKVTIKNQEGHFSFSGGANSDSLIQASSGKPQVVEAQLPASLFTKGVNDLTLSVDEGGSWLAYDAVTLLNYAKSPDPKINSLSATATPFFVKRDGALKRVVNVDLALSGYDTPPTLRASADRGGTGEIPLGPLPRFGTLHSELLIPDSEKTQSVSITAAVGKATRTTEIQVKPSRKWVIYVAPASHTDIGYTALQPVTLEGHSKDIDEAIKLAKKYPDYRWNLEVAVQAEHFLATRDQTLRADFLRLARDGRIGISASYANILTGLLSSAGASHLFQYAADLHREDGISNRWAMVSDVPSLEASYPMIAAHSGVRYLAQGINNDHAPNMKLYTIGPCWWEGPDGSRVLAIFSQQYGLARSWGVCTSMDLARTNITNKLAALEKRADYPYDAVFVHGEQGDNTRLDPKIAAVTQEWNEHYAYPRIVLSSGPDYFEHLEQNFRDKLPVIKGSGGTYWEDGAGSSAWETALDRHAQEKLASAECLLSLAQKIKPGTYPSEEIATAWHNCLLYDEHTWGAAGSIAHPEAVGTVAQWKIKSQYAIDAEKQSENLLVRGTQALAGQIRTTERSLVVFNPSGWNRSEIISVKLPTGLSITEPGVATCATDSTVYAWVENVPACGYRVLKLAPTTSQETARPAAGRTLESRYYRLSFDPATGGIGSIIDQETKRELVDPQSAYKLNQYLYASGGNGGRKKLARHKIHGDFTIHPPQKVTLKKLSLGALGEMMVVESSATMTPRIQATVTIWNHAKRIDIHNQIDKDLTYALEAGYFAFPFAAENPAFRYEIPMGLVNPATDMLPGACLNWFTVQHFIEVTGKAGAVVWTTPDAPLACLQDINPDEWKTALPLTTGHLYSYVFNNYWHTNYRAGQGGRLDFRYAITSRPESDPSASARFGAAVASPLPTAIVGPNPGGSLTARAGSLLGIAEPNVQMFELRQSNDGKGTLVSLWETAGKDTTAHLDARALGIKAAVSGNLVGDGTAPLEVKEGVVAVPLPAHGVATVKLN